MNQISKGFGSLTYWGDQPGTSGKLIKVQSFVFWQFWAFSLLGKNTVIGFWARQFSPFF
ncbi:hypothetical protein LDL59_11460 [Kaistella anthropi]|nr:hypothetical protein [Kaistella anthropi]